MEFKDRLANKPNRVKLTYEDSGASSYATVELADEPIEDGTPLNKKTFDDLQNELKAYAHGVGDVLVTSTNENPSEKLGGTWQLIDKGFKNQLTTVTLDQDIGDELLNGKDGYDSTYYAHAIEKVEIYNHLAGNIVRLRLRFLLKKDVIFDDAGVPMFINLSPQDFGFKQFPISFYGKVCYNDTYNGRGLLLDVMHTGHVSQVDVIGGDTLIAKNNEAPLTLDLVSPIKVVDMLDSFCDKFYWRKISD